MDAARRRSKANEGSVLPGAFNDPRVSQTDLTEPCLKSVQLRHPKANCIARMTSAVYRGCLWHEAGRLLHERDAWENDLVPLVVEFADLWLHVPRKRTAQSARRASVTATRQWLR